MKIIDAKEKPRTKDVFFRDVPQGTVFTGTIGSSENKTFIRGMCGTVLCLDDGTSWNGSDHVQIQYYEPREAELRLL